MTTKNTVSNSNKDESDSAKNQPQTRVYEGATIKVPVFGEIPLRLSEILKDLRIKNNPPLWAQFFKYGVCGVIATLVLALVWVIARVYYADFLDDSNIEQFKLHSTYVMLIAFIVANLVAYFSNRIFVFTPGKHSFAKEMFLFFLISALSFTAGNFAKDWFIDLGLHKDVSAAAFAISSALVNFVARKYLVFSNQPHPETNEVSPSI